MTNRVDLFSATGVLIPGKPPKIHKIEKLVARQRARWITVGVSAQLLYWTDEELEAARCKEYERECQDRADEVPHLGEWQVVQPLPDIASPSGWQLQHPRPNENTMLLEVSA
jgi:hypothetical protein